MSACGELFASTTLLRRVVCISAKQDLSTREGRNPRLLRRGGCQGLSQDQLKALLYNCMKPVEINNSADKRHARVQELLRWFARHATGSANPKWVAEHAFELAYFIATGGMNQHIDLREISQKSFARGFNASESDRSILLRHSCIQPDACVDEDNLKARIAQLEKTVAELRETVINPPTL